MSKTYIISNVNNGKYNRLLKDNQCIKDGFEMIHIELTSIMDKLRTAEEKSSEHCKSCDAELINSKVIIEGAKKELCDSICKRNECIGNDKRKDI